VSPVLGDVRDLGPGSDRVRLFAFDLPGRLGEAQDLGLEWRGHIGADSVRDRSLLAPPKHGGFVERAVGAQEELRDPVGHVAHRLLQHAQVPAARRDLAIAELIVHNHVLLGPEHHHRLVAARPVVGHGRRVLVALHERGIHIQGGRRLPGPALEARDPRAIGGAHARQGGRLQGDRRLGPSRPQGPALDVEGLEDVPHGGRGRQRVSQQRGQGLILAEPREVLAAVPAARPERDETLDELRGRQAALALLDRNLRVDRLSDPELPEQLDHERHPGPARDQRGVNGVIDLERQPRRVLRHRVPPCECCTHWVNGRKRDASAADRVHCGSRRDSWRRSLS
jgi:hypothetical protein